MTPLEAGEVTLKKVFYITVLVSDEDRAAEFYQNTLGIGVSDEMELELDTEGTTVGLFSPGERWPEGKKFIGGHPSNGREFQICSILEMRARC